MLYYSPPSCRAAALMLKREWPVEQLNSATLARRSTATVSSATNSYPYPVSQEQIPSSFLRADNPVPVVLNATNPCGPRLSTIHHPPHALRVLRTPAMYLHRNSLQLLTAAVCKVLVGPEPRRKYMIIDPSHPHDCPALSSLFCPT